MSSMLNHRHVIDVNTVKDTPVERLRSGRREGKRYADVGGSR